MIAIISLHIHVHKSFQIAACVFMYLLHLHLPGQIEIHCDNKIRSLS